MAGEHRQVSNCEVEHHLSCMQRSITLANEAYACFLFNVQNYDFVAAGEYQEKASAYHEAAMDAMVSACRVQQALLSGGAGA